MIAVALKGLLGRKVRALLTAFAVVIGVAMVSGTLVLTDTIQKAFDGIFTASYAQTDAVIAGKEIVKGSQSGAATIPASLLAKVRALPEVAAAGGTIAPIASNQAEIFGRDGKALGGDGAPRFGLGNDASQPQFSPLQLKTGQWPVGPKQVALDAGTAAGENFRVGDTVAVSTLGAKRRYEVTGIASFGGVDSLGGATMAIWDLATAQTLLDKEGRFDSISIAAKEGTSSDDLVRAVQPLVPASLQVKDSEAQAAADAKETNVIVNVVRYFLLGFGGIALFVGAFVIFNTLSITVAQRTREFATLRTLGASRKQVMRSVVIEGLVIGLLASVVGLFAGVGLAKLLTALGGDLPGGRAGVRAADRPRLARARHRDHAAGEHHAGAARHAGTADRGGPRGLDAPTLALRRPLAEHGHRRDRGVRRRHLRRHLRRRAGHAGGRPAARPRRPGAVRGRGPGGPAHGQAADPPGRLPGAPQRRRRRRAGQLELRPPSRPHRLDRRRADDRTHARHRRRGAGLRTAQHRRVRRDRPGLGGLHRQRQRRHAVRGRRGRRARARARREHRLPRPRRQGARRRQGAGRHRRRPGDDRALLPLRLDRRLRRRRRPAQHRRRARDADLRRGPGPDGRREALDPDRVR